MAASRGVAANVDENVRVDTLKFDLQNPRIPNEHFESEDEVIRYLLEDFDVEELIQSILYSGWIDYEPLIVDRSSKVVYEGNRRLAALHLIGDPALRERLQYQLPAFDNARPPRAP